jgi:hypothetical protein
MDYIPKRRINDVVYLEPFDTERPFTLNVLEVHNSQHKDLVSSGIVSIFHKIYGESWGPRLEYVLRNVILTLLDVEGGTLIDVLRILSDQAYRDKVVPRLSDPVLKNFWEAEFARMPDKMKAEVVSPIQNKVGQFVSARMVRNIIGNLQSSVNLQEIMDSGKILILNLSQGKLGEDNAALLGAMVITQIQLAAMNRAFIAEADRRDFFLYVDEFQNFATPDFGQILSEARKYRLNLIVANQFIGQIEEDVKNAIFGNAGTIMSFRVGVSDANYLQHEFQPVFNEQDLINVERYHCYIKTLIGGDPTKPFSLDMTRDLEEEKKIANPRVAELVRELSRLKYGRPSELVEAEIAKRSRLFEVLGDLQSNPGLEGGGEGSLGPGGTM